MVLGSLQCGHSELANWPSLAEPWAAEEAGFDCNMVLC